MKNIGIFRGSFDPIHLGHVDSAKRFYQHLNLDAVWLLPRKNSFYKPNLTPITHRIEMCKLACKNNSWLEVSEFEKNLTTHLPFDALIREIKKTSNDNFILLMAADRFKNITEKDNWPNIFNENSIAVIERKSLCEDIFSTTSADLTKHLFTKNTEELLIPGHWTVVKSEHNDISSTQIRNNLRNCEYSQDLDPLVYDYCRSQNLYMSAILT